jgi:CheY-like chemotaxis protein
MRVLIIDDNRDSSYVVSLLVQHLGHEAMVLTAPQAAVDVAKDFKPEFVFMDLAMPRLDGYEVARRLREQAGLSAAKIVALTAHPRDEDREKASGIDGHVLKPTSAVCLKMLLGDCRDTAILKGQHVN